MPDNYYALTRRIGQRAMVSIFGSVTADPETLKRVENRSTVNVTRVAKYPTTYQRIVRAKAAQQDVGETTFVFWLRDVTFCRLTPQDYIVYGGDRYDFVSSVEEGTGLVATARRVDGSIGSQQITADAANTLDLSGEAEQD